MIFFLGSMTGIGILLLLRGLIPQRRRLHVVLPELLGDTSSVPSIIHVARSSELLRAFDDRYGVFFARLLQVDDAHCKVGLRRDLRMAGMNAEQFAVDKVMLAAFGLVLPVLFLLILQSAGMAIPLVAVLCIGIIFGLVGLIVPNLLLDAEVTRYRRDFRHGLSSLLELVSISMAGGAQVQNAMTDAIKAGRPTKASINRRGPGWVFEELATPLEQAVQERRPPWEHISALGEQLGIPELGELTSSVKAAGSEGANVRKSLAARAQSLRGRRVAEAEGEASETSQKMSFPIALLAFGFLLFIGYPAVVRVFSGFAS